VSYLHDAFVHSWGATRRTAPDSHSMSHGDRGPPRFPIMQGRGGMNRHIRCLRCKSVGLQALCSNGEFLRCAFLPKMRLCLSTRLPRFLLCSQSSELFQKLGAADSFWNLVRCALLSVDDHLHSHGALRFSLQFPEVCEEIRLQSVQISGAKSAIMVSMLRA
jgi:hypothetical protein